MNVSIKELESRLFSDDVTPEQALIDSLRDDERKGVQALLKKWEKKLQEERRLVSKFHDMSLLEKGLWTNGLKLIAGVDEVGRGPLAGPVVAAAVILDEQFFLPGLNDSKQLSEKQRDHFFKIIMREAVSIGIGSVSPKEIDDINIYEATKKAMKLAVLNLAVPPDFLLVDAMTIPVTVPQRKCLKGDENSISIAASSVIAKVTRDRLMRDFAQKYPDFGFDSHMGYGTPQHLQALRENGVTDIHRKSFAPVKQAISS